MNDFSQVRRTASGLALFACCLALCSCAKNGVPLHQVRGSVTYNGLPANKAIVVFHPTTDPNFNGVKPRALVNRDGSFQAFTHAAGDGVAAGDYIVTVTGDKHSKKLKNPAPVDPKKTEGSARVLPPHYESVKSTPLRVTIREGDNDLPPFQLKSK
jgi:hypothetical protein